jgi:hypothetical protein
VAPAIGCRERLAQRALRGRLAVVEADRARVMEQVSGVAAAAGREGVNQAEAHVAPRATSE